MPASIRVFADDSAEPRVRGFLHQPETPTGHALVLTHGAGSIAAAPLLVALCAATCRIANRDPTDRLDRAMRPVIVPV